MDYDALREGLQQAIPFNNHLKLEIREVSPDRGVVALGDHESLRNHVGSQHAGALFAAGEAASGAAFVGAFGERLGDITPLVRDASITYKQPALGKIVATGRTSQEDDELLAALDEDGEVSFCVDVTLANAKDETVAEMSVNWNVKTSG